MEPIQNLIHMHADIKSQPRTEVHIVDFIEEYRSKKSEAILLDAIGILLVFNKPENVAVTQWRTKDELKILWAKDEAVTSPEQLAYIDSLLQMSLDGVEIAVILPIVVDMCWEKILHRIERLARSFTQEIHRAWNTWRLMPHRSSHHEFAERIREHVQFQDRTVIESLDLFTRLLARVASSGHHAEAPHVVKLIFFCYAVTSTSKLTRLLSKVLNGSQVRYLGLLGDYMRSLWLIHQLLRRLRNTKVTVEQVGITSSHQSLWLTSAGDPAGSSDDPSPQLASHAERPRQRALTRDGPRATQVPSFIHIISLS